jgi:hypothetical protein
MLQKVKKFFLNRKTVIFSILSFIIPFIIYILTLERKLVGGDTSWFALQILEMSLMVPTGYPVFSMLEKLFTFIPIGDIALRLNLFSAVFGALTILVLFLAIKRITKNHFVSFISSMIFAFIVPFWEVANRLEFDTLQTFFMALVIFSAILYNENKTRKYLYFFSFCLGLSLTNHPLAFFLVPVIVLYVIIVNHAIFKSARAIFISLLYFALPLLSYMYLPVRSLQGYGEVTTPLKLFYYVTGRGVTGELHGGSFGDKNLSLIIKVIKDYLGMIYNDYGILLLIIALAGFIFLIRKNIKFALCTFLLVILNIIVPPLYAGHALRNYLLNSFIVFSFYTAFGLLFIYRGAIFLFDKLSGNREKLKIIKFLKYSLVVIILICFALLPSCLVLKNYATLDRSEPGDVYKFWEEAFSNMESGSRIYVLARSTNIGKYVNKYVYGEKNIEYISHKVPEFTVENMMEALDNNITVYFVDISGALEPVFNAEQVGKTYSWDRYNEVLKLFKVTEPKVNIEVSYSTDSYVRKFGEKFTIEYTIENKNKKSTKISSLELELPGNIEFVGTGSSGYINQDPGLSRGIYMWVSDSYIIEGESSINIIVELRGTAPGRAPVKFRLTTNKVYIECDDIEIEIKN